MRLRVNLNKDGTKNYYVLESYRTDAGKSTTRIVRKLGTHDELLKEHTDPEAWAQSVVEEMNREARGGKQQIMVPYRPQEQIAMDEQRLFDGGYLFLQKGTSNNRFRNVILRFNLLFLPKSEREPFSPPVLDVLGEWEPPFRRAFLVFGHSYPAIHLFRSKNVYLQML